MTAKEKAPREMCGICGRFFRIGFSECQRDDCPFAGEQPVKAEPEAEAPVTRDDQADLEESDRPGDAGGE